MHWVEHEATSGGASGKSNRITLVRNAKGDGTAETRTIFLDNLHSPFGVALVGNDLYVADTDAIVQYPYTTGDTKITAKGSVLTPLPGGPIDHHWTKSLVASRDGSLLYVGVGSNGNITENGMQAEENRADRGRSTAHRPLAHVRERFAQSQWSHLRASDRRVVGGCERARRTTVPNLVPDYLTSVKDCGFYGWPYSYFGQHLDPRAKPQRPDLVAKAIVPDYALSSHVAPLRPRLQYRHRFARCLSRRGLRRRTRQLGSARAQRLQGRLRPLRGRPAQRQDAGRRHRLPGCQRQRRGRPVGLALDTSGASLIADDVGNTVWRVSRQ